MPIRMKFAVDFAGNFYCGVFIRDTPSRQPLLSCTVFVPRPWTASSRPLKKTGFVAMVIVQTGQLSVAWRC